MIVIGIEHQVNLKLSPKDEETYFSELVSKIGKAKKKSEYVEIQEENLYVLLDPFKIIYLQKGVTNVPQENNQTVQSQA